jgi:hypothetical protein
MNLMGAITFFNVGIIMGMVYTVYTTYLYLFMVIWGLVCNYCFTHIKVNHGTSQISDFNPEYIYI